MSKARVQLVIPMAGDGTRFTSAGYSVPKPLLSIHGRKMFEIVLSNLSNSYVKKALLVAKAEWELGAVIAELNEVASFPVELLELSALSEGPAHTVEFVQNNLDMELPLVVANSDQYLDYKFDHFYECLCDGQMQGAVLTMVDNNPKWSYASLDPNGDIVSIVEKVVVSVHATAGIYGFSKARYFFEALAQMKAQNARVNGEFYVGPVYNYLDTTNGKVANFDMGPVGNVMHGLGVPEDFEAFLQTQTSLRAAQVASEFSSGTQGKA
jgi:NDP-sugar pyrophosphorylase family protein